MTSKVHKVRYYNPKPQSITCVSINKRSKHIAFARCDASIEIWDIKYAPCPIKYIPGERDGSVEALGWAEDRLLSTGLGGALIEWDLDKICVKTTILLTGYAAWCLDVNPSETLVAVGTEQGYVNLYSLENGNIDYKKLFDKQEGRILCCKFDHTGKTLVTGSINTIRVWNVETGHATSRISVSFRGKDTNVWCVASLFDSVIVSGDSRGKLTFWDGALGEQIVSYATHKADILSIAVSDDEKNLYCCGVDPLIVNLTKVEITSSKQSGAQWVKNVQRHIHEHDVKALALNGDQLISVGSDGYLTISGFPPKWVMRIPPLLPEPRSSVSAAKKLLLLRYHNYLEIWKLGSYATNEGGIPMINSDNETENSRQNRSISNLEEDESSITLNKSRETNESSKKNLILTDKPVKLVSIKAKGKNQIRCCEISPSGEFVFYSTNTVNRLLKLDVEIEENGASAWLSRVELCGVGEAGGSARAAFAGDSRGLVLHCGGALLALQLDPDAGASLVQTIDTDKYLNIASIVHVCVSGGYLVASDACGAVAVWARRGVRYQPHCVLPRCRCLAAALTVDIATDMLYVVYSDQTILEYSLCDKKVREWGCGDALPEQWTKRRTAAGGVLPHPRAGPDALVLRDHAALWVLRRGQMDVTPASKKSRQQNSKVNLKILPMKYLAGFHWLGEDEAVAIEVLPEHIVAQLPPPPLLKKI